MPLLFLSFFLTLSVLLNVRLILNTRKALKAVNGLVEMLQRRVDLRGDSALMHTDD